MVEKRDSHGPKVVIAGETIIRQAEFFYFSNLGDVEYVRIYNGSAEEHSEFIEAIPQGAHADVPRNP